MGRALLAVGLALALCFAGIGVLVFLDRGEDRVAVDNVLAEELSRELTLAGESGDALALTDVTDFAWDRVLVVAEDAPRSEITRALGSEFKGDLPYDAESSELLVFARGRELARFADYRGPLRFDGLRRPVDEMTPADAVFSVRSGVIRPAAGR